ncbi:hypothetical protein BLNAU_3891 [Blattamonas nauphoetae]|uniref:Amino acid transporter transmembrane domain-containing protein n=1 Tax=Blattamonas nauphoetae TaxID=2049346 RepID=A0ABQ9YBI0_9EUKA|nr:hypothetical protein BLNAU_3891 [Blattamonas nauphoetae]
MNDRTDSVGSINSVKEETRLVWKDDTDPKGMKLIGEFGAYGVILNGLIGAGFFSIPKTYFEAGLIFSILLMSFCAIFSILGAIWTLENIARARGVSYSRSNRIRHNHTHNQMTFSVYSFTDISKIFLGFGGQLTVVLLMATYGVMSMWMFSSMFASTSANLIVRYFLQSFDTRECIIESNPSDVCQKTYNCVLVGFGLVTLTIEVLGMKYLSRIQIFFTVYRFLAFGTIIVSCIISLAFNGSYWLQDTANIEKAVHPWYKFQWNSFPSLFSAASFALTACYHLPTILAPMKGGKKHASGVTIAAFLTVAIVYMGIGSLVTLALGDDVLHFVILNYSNFGARGFTRWSDIDSPRSENWFSTIIKLIVMLFPVMNLLSSFPLVSTTMSTNIVTLIPPHIRSRAPDLIFLCINFTMSLAPLILSSFFPSLGIIVRFTGIISIFVACLIPTFFNFYSRLKTKPEDKTPFSGWWSRSWVSIITFLYGGFCLVYSLIQLITILVKK